MSATDLRETIRLAREQHRAGAGSVLDVLLRDHPVAEVASLLQRSGGIAMLNRVDHAQVDFSRLPIDLARQWRCVVVRGPALPASLLALEDPWDDQTLRRVSSRVGEHLVPAAVAWMATPAVPKPVSSWPLAVSRSAAKSPAELFPA